ncbi:hypothetical protein DYBT9275_01722 [Dyadobacter sp. CECT 9275]|uniref:Exo-alpha-sialidase n=1 Tax=Dyadobacter helix TaxID=2822344 RepID=A0A916N3P6_9BACT|nr:sialidase family protein [Dyadobacter sp. CECT 9275]CAG4997239.1 hypothetical protein DYBT9275_01722 [Dyadobacter sp. CECT 9275]
MKKSFVFIPAVLLVLILLNSFVLKEKEAKKKPVKVGKSAGTAHIIFRSTDGGQTWQDISEGLPEKLQKEGVWRDGVFANDHGIYLRAGNGFYHSEPNAATSFWTQENFPGRQRNITPGRDGIFAYDFRGQFLQKANGTGNWSPVYGDFQHQAMRIDTTTDWMTRNYHEKIVHNVFETREGTVLVSSNNVLFRSANKGKTWEPVHAGGGAMKLTASDGVLVATSKEGILRSTDDGQNWEYVIREEGAGIAVERIDGGFAAILNNPETQTNSVHISLNGGETWTAIGDDLLPSWGSVFMKRIGLLQSLPSISSIKQVGKYLVCSRADGIFRSADRGKTWQPITLPSTEKYGFSLSVSGNVMYVMPNKGC